MKMLIALATLAVFWQAPQQSPHANIVSGYENAKIHIAQLRTQLRQQHITDTAALQAYFVHAIADSIIPYWYGTVWDFNGTTQTPRNGAIACGYFVTTVLRDAGLVLNRVKMGQSSSEDITYAFCRRNDIKLFYDKPLATMLKYVQSKGFGLYIIGLDSHVGFLYNDGSATWFIHAKWFDEKAVVKEDAATSAVLYYSNYRMVGKISNNASLLHKWVYGN